MKKSVILVVCLVFLICSLESTTAGIAHYCDPSTTDTVNDGTYAHPFKTLEQINNHAFEDGDDLYFKVGTVLSATSSAENLQVRWDGSANDHVEIGAYFGEGQFGLNGNPRPILDGQFTYPTNIETGLIARTESSAYGNVYIDIKDIQVNRSNGYGILSKYVDNFIVENCEISYSWRQAIILIAGSHMTITKNIIHHAMYRNYPDNSDRGADVVINGWHKQVTDAEMSYNKIYNSYGSEVLAAGYVIDGVLIEGNVLWDNKRWNVGIYNNQAINSKIRYNIVYGSSDVDNWKRAQAISISNEYEVPQDIFYTHDIDVYGNLLANNAGGVSIGCAHPDGTPYNINIYSNTIIDSIHDNLHFWSDAGEVGSGNEIKDNIFLSTSGGKNTNNDNPVGYTWSNNIFYGGSAVSGNAANNAIFADPLLANASGWNSMPPGDADPDWWRPLEGSPAIDNGASLKSPYDVDFGGVSRPQGNGWDIGAFESTSSTETCSQGQITSTCVCGGTSYSIGYCCNGDWQSTVCSVPKTNSYTILKTNYPPVIDGDLSEFVNANSFSIIEPISGSIGIYNLLWDDNAVYIAASVSDSELNSDETVRDRSGIWSDDAVEIFFDTLNSKGNINPDDYKFFVNLLNTNSDAKGVSDNMGFDTTWDSLFSSVVTKTGTLNVAGDTDSGYTIEARIPWTAFGMDAPMAGSVMGFDLSLRDEDDTGNMNYKAWSNADAGGFNNPGGWGEITFSSQYVVSGSECNSFADSNGDSSISIGELINYISEWKSGNVSILKLVEAIDNWKNGCGRAQ